MNIDDLFNNRENKALFIGQFDTIREIPHNMWVGGYVAFINRKIYIYLPGRGWTMTDHIFGDINVIDFIKNFSNNNDAIIDIFMNGYCYWFARILKERFNGSIVYNPIYNHFACKIGENIYDVKGYECRYNDDENRNQYIYWEKFKEIEPIESLRIYRDCILKIPSKFEIDKVNKTCNGERLKVYNEEDELQ